MQKNTFLLIMAIIAFLATAASFGTNSRYEVHAKISELAYDSGLTYKEVKDYCYTALTNGQECYINNQK